MSKSLSLAIFDDAKVAARLRALNPLGSADADRAYRVLVAQIKTPALAKCSSQSLLLAACNVAKLGLNPDPQLGHVYLVPFGEQATVIVGYKGFIELARRSERVTIAKADLIYAGDLFEYFEGADRTHFRHAPAWMRGEKQGELLGGYALLQFTDGSRQVHVIGAAEIDKARQRSRASSRGPWIDDREAMQRKTVIRRAATYWPLSAELARAVDLDHRADEGQPQGREEELGEVLDAEILDEGTRKIGEKKETTDNAEAKQ